jgi:hypothetical protein
VKQADPTALVAPTLGTMVATLVLGGMLYGIHSSVKSAGERLATPETDKPAVAVAPGMMLQ